MLPISNGQTNLVASKGDGGCGLDCHSHYFASIGIDPRRHINGNDRGGGVVDRGDGFGISSGDWAVNTNTEEGIDY